MHKQRTDDSAVPQVSISSFQIESLIGKGGFGSVYRGIWEGIDVAIKQCHLENLTFDLLQEFIKEAKIMHKCQHPNIVKFFAICVKQGKDCLIMEFLPNGSLFQNLSDSR
jgi:serine/threonine protein kinase